MIILLHVVSVVTVAINVGGHPLCISVETLEEHTEEIRGLVLFPDGKLWNIRDFPSKSKDGLWPCMSIFALAGGILIGLKV